MAYNPELRGVEYITFLPGVIGIATQQLQVNPTIAAGDFQVSKDGGALANLSTLPAVTPAGSTMIKITLSATEMTADNVTLIGIDAAGGEWASMGFTLQPMVAAPATAAAVNAEVLDVLTVDTFAEPSAVPAATASLKDKIGWQQVVARNRIEQTALQQDIKNDAAAASIGTALVSDNGTVAVRGKFN